MLCKWAFVEGRQQWIWACAFDNLHYQGIKQMLMCSVSLHTSPELIWWPNFSWWKRSTLYLLINLNSTILLGAISLSVKCIVIGSSQNFTLLLLVCFCIEKNMEGMKSLNLSFLCLSLVVIHFFLSYKSM